MLNRDISQADTINIATSDLFSLTCMNTAHSMTTCTQWNIWHTQSLKGGDCSCFSHVARIWFKLRVLCWNIQGHQENNQHCVLAKTHSQERGSVLKKKKKHWKTLWLLYWEKATSSFCSFLRKCCWVLSGQGVKGQQTRSHLAQIV